MESNYKHTQFGVLTVAMLLLIGLLVAPIIWPMINDGRGLVALFTAVFYLLILLSFYALTVEVSDSKLKFWFGIGLIRKTIALVDIETTRPVKDPWYYFWGIKSIPGGWFYAIAPGEAVEIVLKDEKIIHVGTNQSRKLKEALDQAMSAGQRPN